MKTDITNTKLWAEFLEWLDKGDFVDLDYTDKRFMLDVYGIGAEPSTQVSLPIGALIGILEQFLWDKDKTFFNVATNMIKKFSCMVFALNEDAYHSKGEFDNPLLAKSEAIYQYFKSKG